jgi:hypothetical protein
MLSPLIEQLVPTIEAVSIKQITSRAEKAHLPGMVIEDMQKEAAWNPAAKKAIEISAPQVAAKWMNKTGISAEHQPEVVLGTAVVAIVAGHCMILKRLDELIKKTNPPVEPEKAKGPVSNDTGPVKA